MSNTSELINALNKTMNEDTVTTTSEIKVELDLDTQQAKEEISELKKLISEMDVQIKNLFKDVSEQTIPVRNIYYNCNFLYNSTRPMITNYNTPLDDICSDKDND